MSSADFSSLACLDLAAPLAPFSFPATIFVPIALFFVLVVVVCVCELACSVYLTDLKSLEILIVCIIM